MLDSEDNTNSQPSGAPVITGVAEQGQTLAVDLSGIVDPDGIDETTLSYTWLRDGEVQASTDTITLEQGDVGGQYSVQVSYTDNAGHAESITSALTAEVLNVNDPASGALLVIFRPTPDVGLSSPFEGQSLSIGLHDIVDPDGISSDGSIQFFRDGEPIEITPPLLYRLQQSDVGSIITASYTYVDGFGATETVYSLPEGYGPVKNVDTAAFGEVLISGEVLIGETLTADASGVDDTDGMQNVTAFEYQWFRDGVSLAGENASTFQITEADTGATLSVSVSFTDDFGMDETVVSEDTDTVESIVGLVLRGTAEAEALIGTNGEDTIQGLGADDTLTGGRADDILEGGNGIDTAVFTGHQSGYSVLLYSDGQTTIQDRGPGGDGTDTLTSIEFLDFETEVPLFNDEPMNLNIFDGPAGLSAAEFGAIVELYIAYFNRAPDALGLFYWGTRYAEGHPLSEMANDFFNQDETRATYASVLDDNFQLDVTDPTKVGDFVNEVYSNVLGRTPDQPGYEYWTDELTNNENITPANFILSIIGGAKFPSNPTPQTDIDQAYLATKADLGVYYSVIKGLSDIQMATDVMDLYDGTQFGLTDAIDTVDYAYAQALDPETGQFIIGLVGVLDDPFAIA
ncbi:DUF4214 domain-containing protein [Sulfitobacter mediterraneus]|uniref:DUF4214 domain-containing protein n=2 Tax=Sulfitobacter mediterraneus TaxID=83219 RepID=UPI00193330EE|nr:DUF4214 domain-containing protein [Sulfitobacter mediterraneus]MBM1312317.1 DUF4214 domain-containing protein [Sulfitobacter mediterraneus]MBM1316195.1 DUF4214 domain-containing protein [Sulfitobacter mediterraneus]MBM1324561.1 DUF4214 domain-containing protein [Sulfitobacter mediterraneus]MBM1328471.1 DUF4214 domain-containing protein [Sulfitobacter mediterraneus]MBM1399821.1 DUF4214 domain-containing protein [Sulfitobacter mediterraneus]